ncbi:hypothetical protein [Paraburkholderia susongensis]|uniref:hypothetical protein n=1 Tax=Paraburkholderia susongensis TaxID=1515439 RepID=UPI00117D764E|nr:hypothetical protein [Paraburkholderia susongensis]
MQAAWTSVDEYIVDRLVHSDDALKNALSANTAADLPPHDVARNQGKLLNIFARMISARRVLGNVCKSPCIRMRDKVS